MKKDFISIFMISMAIILITPSRYYWFIRRFRIATVYAVQVAFNLNSYLGLFIKLDVCEMAKFCNLHFRFIILGYLIAFNLIKCSIFFINFLIYYPLMARKVANSNQTFYFLLILIPLLLSQCLDC